MNTLLDNFFDDTFAIRKMNYINYTDDVKYNDDGATIKIKNQLTFQLILNTWSSKVKLMMTHFQKDMQ